MLGNDTYSAEAGIGCRTGIVGLLYRCILAVFWERNLRTLYVLLWVVVVGAWVHVSIGNTKVFSNICSDPVSWVLVVHWDNVCLILAWTWHIKVLSPRVKLHAEGKLSLLFTSGISIIRIPRIGEVKVTWDVVLWAWNSHELHLVALFLLHCSDFGVTFRIDSRAFTTLGSHAEWCTLLSVCNMNWVVSAWA